MTDKQIITKSQMIMRIAELSANLEVKEQECEELKKQLTILDDEDVVVEITVKQFEEYKKLKQTLTEIKEIAEAESYLSPQSTRLLVHKILQKISEVENET